MKEQLISFKTAKLAKEKGFPQDLFNTSWYNYFGVKNGRTDLNENGVHVCKSGYFQTREEKANNKNEKYIAPTQSLLQKWLREVHQINLFMSTWGEKNEFYHVEDITKGIGNDMIVIGNGGKGSIDYEEALEAGLYEALKKISL